VKKVLALISHDAKKHPGALSGHYLAARFLEENAVKHNRYLSILNFQKSSCNSSSIFLS
jgi:hypothetical protein